VFAFKFFGQILSRKHLCKYTISLSKSTFRGNFFAEKPQKYIETGCLPDKQNNNPQGRFVLAGCCPYAGISIV
jgi:hypothetical protein